MAPITGPRLSAFCKELTIGIRALAGRFCRGFYHRQTQMEDPSLEEVKNVLVGVFTIALMLGGTYEVIALIWHSLL